MAVCALSMDKNTSFLPPVHHNEKKNSKLFSNLTSRKMFGRFLGNKFKENDSNVRVCGQNSHENLDNLAEKRRPLVLNKENHFNGKIDIRSETGDYQRLPARIQSPLQNAKPRKSNEGSKLRTCLQEDEGPRNRFHSPPRLISVSGKLSSERIRDIIKPIPCKPLTPSFSSVKMASSHDCIPIHDEGYNSQNMSSSSAATTSSSSSSNTSSNLLVDKSVEFETNQVRQVRQLRPRPKSSTVSCTKKQQCDDVPLKNCSRMSELQVNDCTSLLDSFQPGVPMPAYHHPALQHSLDHLLLGKDRELHDMRSRMEANERTMTSVIQTKEMEWHKEMEELDDKWREKLRWQQEKSARSERGFLLEIVELRKENDVLKDRLNGSERDKTSALNERNEAQKSVRQLKTHLEQAHRQTTRKLDEIVSQRPQVVHSSTGDGLRTALSSQNVPQSSLSPLTFEEVQGVEGQDFQPSRRRRSLGCKLNSSKSTPKYEDHFPDQLDDVVSQMEDLKKQNQLEHYLWMCEKSKVIEYQKKLQSNYLEICQKNQSLQDEVIRLRRKLEMNSLETESFC